MSSNVPRFAYFGLPLGALALARAGFCPHVIVLGHSGAPGGRRVHRQLTARVLLERPALDDPKVVAQLAEVPIDAILSWFYPRQIPEPVLALAPRGAFGVHPSLLPRWRGPDPYFWAIRAGDAVTGVSLHRLEPEYDTGAVIAQRTLAIDPREHALRLARRLDRPGLALLVECATRLAAGEALQGEPQDDAAATAAPTPDEDTLSIDWHAPADAIVRLVRAAAPYPAASAALGDEVVDVIDADRYPGRLPRALEPADAVWTPHGLVVCAADAGVLVRRVRRDDGALVSGDALRRLFPHELASVGAESGGRATLSGTTEG